MLGIQTFPKVCMPVATGQVPYSGCRRWGNHHMPMHTLAHALWRHEVQPWRTISLPIGWPSCCIQGQVGMRANPDKDVATTVLPAVVVKQNGWIPVTLSNATPDREGLLTVRPGKLARSRTSILGYLRGTPGLCRALTKVFSALNSHTTVIG